MLGHCTEKTKLRFVELWKDVFDLFGLDLMLINAGCCGKAGTYGHETEHYKSHWYIQFKLEKKNPRRSILQAKNIGSWFFLPSQVKRFDGFCPLHPVQALLREIKSVFLKKMFITIQFFTSENIL
ncbi:MAG: hypothetical protein CM1200mP28_07290 [Deltaproteobacteria bacterium]|nr:MAG: hypothetical protein CM1200mP28_07290 [Deltaproteobacteria bacterium]